MQDRQVFLMGANPFVTLYAQHRAVAFASVWRVDWSERGSGRALVMGDRDGVRVVATAGELGFWLADRFNQHFRDVRADLPWTRPRVDVGAVEFDLDHVRGFRGAAGGVVVEITDPIVRLLTRNDAYDLGGEPVVLSTVWTPCRNASITVDGVAVAGAPLRRADTAGPYSSAAIADAEVWCRLDDSAPDSQ